MWKRNLLTLAAVSAMTLAQATSTVFTYVQEGEMGAFGTGKAETYSVAMLIDNQALLGCDIQSIKVAVVPTDFSGDVAAIGDFSLWLSTSLDLENKKNAPNVASWSMDYPTEADEDGYAWIEFQLPETYKIPRTGMYVGYSLTVSKTTDAGKRPIAICSPEQQKGFFVHSTRTYKTWADRGTTAGGVLPMYVTVDGDFQENAVSVSMLNSSYYMINQVDTASATLSNTGTNEIKSIAYTSKIADAEYSGVIAFDEPIPAVLGAQRGAVFTLPAVNKAGSYIATVEITQVNGAENTSSSNIAEAEMAYVAYIPERLSVVEEYTGLWCGWCPRGFVAMEKMNEFYPEFPGIAYHNGDAMAIPNSEPSNVAGYPSSVINRALEVDPYDPTGAGHGTKFTMPSLWEEFNEFFTPVSLDVEAEFVDESTIQVKTQAYWAAVPFDRDVANYRIEYVLVADGLSDPTWVQNNNYSGYSGVEYMEMFETAGSRVLGLEFNDVAIKTSGLRGVPGSLAEMSIEKPTTHEYTFDVSNIVNTSGQPIPFHKDKLKVVAMVLSGSGTGIVENAKKCSVAYNQETTALRQLQTSDIESVEYFDLTGRKVINPEEGGMLIRSTRYTNGKVLNEKIAK